MKNVFRILAVILLGLSVANCELFDSKEWQEARERREERGVRCYRYPSGNVYCEDKDGNRAY